MAERSVVAVLAVLCGIGCAAWAQDDPRTIVTQTNTVAPGQASATGATQVARPASIDIAVGPPALRDRRLAGSAPPTTEPVPHTQLNQEAATAEAGRQLSTEPGGVGPAPSAAARAQGRVTAVVTPRGPDRCDPQGGRVLPEGCEKVIEARAGDFPAPDPQPLSAEQRLLATQRELRPMSLDVGTATRRLASGQVDDSTAALAVASMTLSNRDPVNDNDEESVTDTSTIDAIVAGITTLVTGAPPTP